MAMCLLLRSRLTASPKAFHVRSSQLNVCRLGTVDFRPDGAVGNPAFRIASVNDQIALLVKEAAEVRGLVDKQDARIANQDARIAKQDARIAKQDARIAKQGAKLAELNAVILVIGEDKVINVATQVCIAVRYVELTRLYDSGFLEKKPKMMFYETTASPYSSLLRLLKDVSMKPLMEDVPDGETIEAFAVKMDALYRDRNRSTHPPSTAELDRMVEAALMLVSPQMAAQSPSAAHACFILQAYRDKLKPLMRPYLLAAAEEEA